MPKVSKRDLNGAIGSCADCFLVIIDHFNAVAEAILSAKSEIYIADWWLSPELVR